RLGGPAGEEDLHPVADAAGRDRGRRSSQARRRKRARGRDSALNVRRLIGGTPRGRRRKGQTGFEGGEGRAGEGGGPRRTKGPPWPAHGSRGGRAPRPGQAPRRGVVRLRLTLARRLPRPQAETGHFLEMAVELVELRPNPSAARGLR